MKRCAPALLALALGGCGAAGSGNGQDMVIAGGAGTHVIGIYEGPSEHRPGYREVGDLAVHIEDQGSASLALALTSYEPVNVILQGPGAEAVRAVYLDGHHRHGVFGGRPGLRIINYSGDKANRPDRDGGNVSDDWGSGSGSYSYRHVASANDGGNEREAIVTNAQIVLGSPIASVSQSYRVESVRIESP